MTNREAYVMGWVYGYLYRVMGYPVDFDRTGNAFADAAGDPSKGFVLIHQQAAARGVLTDDVAAALAAALAEVSDTPYEAPLPLPVQGSWQLGYYKALGGSPLPPALAFDIKSRRQAKGWTQARLADEMGVEQAQISRWETGVNKPNNDTLRRIQELL